MRQVTKISSCILLFICVEVFLFLFVDQPLSLYLRKMDAQAPWFINLFRFYTDLGKSQWYLWPSGVAIILGIVLSRAPLQNKYVYQNIGLWGQKLIFFFVCVAASGVITDIIKSLLGRARPVLLDHEKLYGFHPLSFTSVWNSMPSGHATTAVTVALVLALFMPRWRFAWWGIGFLLSISRVMVNAHYLSDILAGACVAFLTVRVLNKVFDTKQIVDLCSNRLFVDRKKSQAKSIL